MTCPEWLTARPIAHRGLHDAERGVIENTSSVVAAAVQAGYAIEVDLQRSADGEAMVFHDDALGRLTEAGGLVRDRTAAELKRLAFKDTADRMMTLGELLDLVGGRTPLVLELKSHFDGDIAIAMRTAALLRGAPGRSPPCRSTRASSLRSAGARQRSCAGSAPGGRANHPASRPSGRARHNGAVRPSCSKPCARVPILSLVASRISRPLPR